MVSTTEAHAIGNVVSSTTIPDLLDVVSEHAVPRLSLAAPQAVLNVFAPATSASDHRLTPYPILRCEVERIDFLGWWLDRSAVVSSSDQRSQRLHLPYTKQKPRCSGHRGLLFSPSCVAVISHRLQVGDSPWCYPLMRAEQCLPRTLHSMNAKARRDGRAQSFAVTVTGKFGHLISHSRRADLQQRGTVV